MTTESLRCMLGAVVLPLGSLQLSGLLDLLLAATPPSAELLPKPLPSWLTPETGHPSAVKLRNLQPPLVRPSRDDENPSTALLTAGRLQGNGKPLLRRKAGGSKLCQQVALRAGGGAAVGRPLYGTKHLATLFCALFRFLMLFYFKQ